METVQTAKTDGKRKNHLEVLRFLQKNGAKPRIDIAKALHLTKAAITVITNEMIKSGMLVEKGEQITADHTHTRGRRKIFLDINENYKLVFGVVIEKGRLLVGLTNLKGQPLDKAVVLLGEKSYRELLELIVEIIGKIMRNNCIANENLLAMGVCVSTGCGERIEGSTVTEKLSRLRKDLAHAVSIKIYTGKTADGALIAQKLFAGGDCASSMLMLRYGAAIESGVMLNNRLYTGFTGKAGGFFIGKTLSAQENEEEAEASLREMLTEEILLCSRVLDTERIYCFGSFFEQEERRTALVAAVGKKSPKTPKLRLAVVTDETTFLAACAQAVDSSFYINSAV